jgi:hypothetical protein
LRTVVDRTPTPAGYTKLSDSTRMIEELRNVRFFIFSDAAQNVPRSDRAGWGVGAWPLSLA